MSREARTEPPQIQDFIARWAASAARERANYQLFLSELCDVLGVPRPDPSVADDRQNAYVFDWSVTFTNGDGTTDPGFIDLYKRGCFVLEAKQGSDRDKRTALETAIAPRKGRKGKAVRGTRGWDAAMLAARGQAEQYARALPAFEGWPPILVVVDVGHSFELYTDFSRAGKTYVPFPDPRSHRILLADLADEAMRERLRLVWTDPLGLDPTRRSAKVTREVAGRLALLARSLEEAGRAPKSVADFLMRCLFTMFAEDVELLPKTSFTRLLESLRGEAEKFPPLVRSLWQTMNEGGFSPILRETLLQFDGGLFENPEALPLTEEQLGLLIEASKADWHEVEPAIFGTLLERALDARERHKIGAHYTPRAYVERLVMPTIIEPLREDWNNVRAAAVTHAREGHLDAAIREVRAFHDRLCEIRVLDPACGSGNFLYVTLEHMKRLEGEVLNTLEALGEADPRLELAGHTVDPHQFLGIEINPRAAVIAEMVLWIGFLQWHFRTRGKVAPPVPVLKKFQNIEQRDAVLASDKAELLRDEHGKPVTHWDGRTTKRHPVTGAMVPDESARVEFYRYINPRKADWPRRIS